MEEDLLTVASMMPFERTTDFPMSRSVTGSAASAAHALNRSTIHPAMDRWQFEKEQVMEMHHTG